MLEARSIGKRFGGLVVLSDVGLRVPEGTIVGLIGPNGAGKTTLFNILAGAMRPNAGSVHFQGRVITGLSPERRSRLGFARTFQIAKPFARLSVLENVMIGAFSVQRRTVKARELAHGALERVGLADRAKDSADSLTLVGRKQLELARCLATQPVLMLLDEVLCGLNPTEITTLTDTLKTLRAGGMTLVVIEHVIDVIRELADEVVVLNEGKNLHHGKPEEVLRNPRVIEAYLGGGLGDADA